MSSMLEQAIVDAEALKEAAIKNAEAAIIDKYSSEVKDAVNSLLEQEEEALEEEEVEEYLTDLFTKEPDPNATPDPNYKIECYGCEQ